MTQPKNQEINDDGIRERIEVEAPGFKFKLDDADSWSLIGKAVVLILSVYGGIKLINWIVP